MAGKVVPPAGLRGRVADLTDTEIRVLDAVDDPMAARPAPRAGRRALGRRHPGRVRGPAPGGRLAARTSARRRPLGDRPGRGGHRDRRPRPGGRPHRGVGRRRHAAGARTASPALVLCGHTDVVPRGRPGAVARRPVRPAPGATACCTVAGTCDMKGGLVAALAAARAVAGRPGSGWSGRWRCTAWSARRTAASAPGPPCAAGTAATPASSPSPPPVRCDRQRRCADLPARRDRPGRARRHARPRGQRRRGLRRRARRAAGPSRPTGRRDVDRVRWAPGCPTGSRSARCRPATGPPPCPTGWSPRGATACGSTNRSRPRRAGVRGRGGRVLRRAPVAGRPPGPGRVGRRQLRQRPSCRRARRCCRPCSDAVADAGRRPPGRAGRAGRHRPAALRRRRGARPCTTAPATWPWRTARASRSRSPRWCTWPGCSR